MAEVRMVFLTGVCCWDDGTKEEAVSEVEIPPKLTHNFHKGHKSVHDDAEREEDGQDSHCCSDIMQSYWVCWTAMMSEIELPPDPTQKTLHTSNNKCDNSSGSHSFQFKTEQYVTWNHEESEPLHPYCILLLWKCQTGNIICYITPGLVLANWKIILCFY